MQLIYQVIEYCFAVLCKHCKRMVIDPDKHRGQKYLVSKCPHCYKDGFDQVEKNFNVIHR